MSGLRWERGRSLSWSSTAFFDLDTGDADARSGSESHWYQRKSSMFVSSGLADWFFCFFAGYIFCVIFFLDVGFFI